MAVFQKRQTAYRLWISDLLNSQLAQANDGMPPNFFTVHNREVHRVNFIANVVFKFETPDRSYGSVTIDDGSGALRLKAWREDAAIFNSIKVGDMVLVIGRPKSYNGEIYVNPELIKVLEDPNWELVRKLELLKEYGQPSKISEAVDELSYDKPLPQQASDAVSITEEEVVEDVTETLRQKIITLVESNSGDKGLEFSQLVRLSGLGESQVDSIVRELISEGEVFEPRKGFLKVV